jgi:MFS transporter, DHA2 family, glioxin efflux transporter
MYAWNSSQVVGLLIGFVVLSATFAAWEWCLEDRAMVPFRLAGDRAYLVSSVFAFFFSGAYFLIVYYLPIYFQSIDNVSPEISGVRNLPLILAVTISMLASGADHRRWYCLRDGLYGLLYTLDIGTKEGKWIGYQIIGGVGWAITSQIPIITSRLPPRLRI